MEFNQGSILVKHEDVGIKNTIAEFENGHGLDPEPDRLGSDSRDQCLDRRVKVPMAMSVARNWREDSSFA